MSDFATWEPGATVVCLLCGRERGGQDPPGPWHRHHPSQRRRIPIFGSERGSILGYLEVICP